MYQNRIQGNGRCDVTSPVALSVRECRAQIRIPRAKMTTRDELSATIANYRPILCHVLKTNVFDMDLSKSIISKSRLIQSETSLGRFVRINWGDSSSRSMEGWYGGYELPPWAHTLDFVIVGSNQKATGYKLGNYFWGILGEKSVANTYARERYWCLWVLFSDSTRTMLPTGGVDVIKVIKVYGSQAGRSNDTFLGKVVSSQVGSISSQRLPPPAAAWLP